MKLAASKKFGGTTAVDNLSLQVAEHPILGLLGPNGTGKSSLFNLINGIYKADAARCITSMKPQEIAQKGIARMFQEIRVFRKMTALQNILVPVLGGKIRKTRARKCSLDRVYKYIIPSFLITYPIAVVFYFLL